MIIEKAIKRIRNEEIRAMTQFFYEKYKNKIEELPASISGKYHLGENHRVHIERVLFFVNHLIKEFNIKGNDKDILISASILHDMSKYEFISKEPSL